MSRRSYVKKIVFYNTKGGTGKTTLCFNYGWHLAEHKNKHVLMMDFDPQANLVLAFNRGFRNDKGKNLDGMIVDFLNKKPIVLRDYLIPVANGMDLLPTSNNISLIEEFVTDTLFGRAVQEHKAYTAIHRNILLKRMLDQAVTEGSYDYVVIDSQPNYSLLSATALVYARNVIAVLKPELFSFLDVRYLEKVLASLSERFACPIQIACGIINGYEKGRRGSDEMVRKIMQRYGTKMPILRRPIRSLSHFQLSIALSRQPVFLAYPNSEATADIAAAFHELDAVLEKNIIDH